MTITEKETDLVYEDVTVVFEGGEEAEAERVEITIIDQFEYGRPKARTIDGSLVLQESWPNFTEFEPEDVPPMFSFEIQNDGEHVLVKDAMRPTSGAPDTSFVARDVTITHEDNS